MNPSSDIDSDLLARYVAGEADDAQRLAVEHWAASSAVNARELERFRSLWSMSDAGASAGEVDVEAAWRKVSARMDDGRVIPMNRSRRSAWGWVAAAAAIVGLLLVGRVLLSQDEDQVFVADISYVTVTLPDSSVVTLSPGTRLVATVEAERRVQLNGQAYFEVEHDEQRPFVVEAGDQEVTVLGTAFEVTQHAGSDSLVVRVRNGRVGVSQPNATHMTVLVGGERGVWVGSNERERTETSPVERWAGRIIQFSNAPLQQVVEELNTLYDVHIELGSEAITACPLTASFGDEPIDEIIRVIAGTFGLEVARSPDGAFTLTGDGC